MTIFCPPSSTKSYFRNTQPPTKKSDMKSLRAYPISVLLTEKAFAIRGDSMVYLALDILLRNGNITCVGCSSRVKRVFVT